MWNIISRFIIQYRIWLLVITTLITSFMAYKAKDVEITYDFVKVVPENDEDLIYFKDFLKTFGEDGNILVIGFKEPSVFELEKFKKFQKLSQGIASVEGITNVISIPTLKKLVKDPVEKKFVLEELFKGEAKSQQELDSLLKEAENLKFYEGLIENTENKATLLAVTVDKTYLNSSRRQEVIGSVMDKCEAFSKTTGIKLHYAGLPYVRSIMVGKVQHEFKFFLVLAAVVTSLILFVFFRSFFAVFFTFLVIVITVLWTMGTIVLLDYKITLLTGMLPALIIVIGIPNCIYMYNKYHQEFRKHGNKTKAISRIIQKIGFLTFMTNANTAVGFFVLYFTDITIIKEFGMVAGVLSLATFIITLAIIPPLLYLLPAPNSKQLKHLDLGFLRHVNTYLERVVTFRRPVVYGVTLVLVTIAIYGITRIQSVSYMVDDLPESSNVKSDLAFFEENFKGVMPLEIVIDLGKPKGIMKASNLKKLEEFEEYLKGQKFISPPISILNIVKGSTQAFYNGDPESYRLPSNNERQFILQYLGNKSTDKGMINAFVDSTGQYVRFTSKVADLGTNRMNVLVKEVEDNAKAIFGPEGFKVKVTGTTLLFLKGNEYLINDLTGSLFFAFILISLMMAMIFANIRMIVISLIPNLVPMILTAGIMGLFNIPLKPSTALIFSISFGISIDSTIHYLSKYKQDLSLLNGDIKRAVIASLHETGVSMIYTSIVLFCGFIIFAWSDFGGTVALGLLTSLTLFFAMFTNLTLLPTLLLTFGKHSKLALVEELEEDEEEETEESFNPDFHPIEPKEVK